MNKKFDPMPKRLSNEDREKLEMILGYKMCQFSAFRQMRGPKELFDDGIACVYICGIDIGPARGGTYLRIGEFEGHIKPCSLEYARMCPLYPDAHGVNN